MLDVLVAVGAASSLIDRGYSLRRSTRYNVIFPASRKYHQYLGISSSPQSRLCGGPIVHPPPAALPSLPPVISTVVLRAANQKYQ